LICRDEHKNMMGEMMECSHQGEGCGGSRKWIDDGPVMTM
jgi:hypothetical protein